MLKPGRSSDKMKSVPPTKRHKSTKEAMGEAASEDGKSKPISSYEPQTMKHKAVTTPKSKVVHKKTVRDSALGFDSETDSGIEGLLVRQRFPLAFGGDHRKVSLDKNISTHS